MSRFFLPSPLCGIISFDMAKVFGPLFSLSATGVLGNAIDFFCGEYARKIADRRNMKFSDAQTDRQTKWSGGCKAWQDAKKEYEDYMKSWNKYRESVRAMVACPAGWFPWMSGFQVFMSLYMRKGPGGWAEYPLPPE